jgi:4-amino-4-deoxy-L-arabinose transferase-like glycosyltransferase
MPPEQADRAGFSEKWKATGGIARLWLLWLVVFCCSLTLYSLTASREVQWQDSGEFVLRVFRGEVLDEFGLALSHPLHFWCGTLAVRVLPLEPPFAVALVSALFGAIAVANVFGVVTTLTGRRLAAGLAALGLALAHTFWHMSTVVEVYTITAAALSAELWALVKWDQTRKRKWLVLMFLANGIGLANHNLALLTLPVITIVLVVALYRRQAGWGTLVGAGIVWVIGASPYIGLVLQQVWVTRNISDTLRSALVGEYQTAVAGQTLIAAYTLASVAFTLLNFPNLMLPAAILGATRAPQAGVGSLSRFGLSTGLILHLLFVLRYGVIDQYTFLVPSYTIVAILSGIGFAYVLRNWPPRVTRWVVGLSIGLPVVSPLVYLAASSTARHFHVLGRFERNKPYRDDYRYLFVPWGRGEDSASRLSQQAIELADDDGLVIVEDEMAEFAVEYRMYREDRSGIMLMSYMHPRMVEKFALSGKAVVLIPYSRNEMPVETPVGRWRRLGDLYVLEDRSSTSEGDGIGSKSPQEERRP